VHVSQGQDRCDHKQERNAVQTEARNQAERRESRTRDKGTNNAREVELIPALSFSRNREGRRWRPRSLATLIDRAAQSRNAFAHSQP
jgi:hypothetical protein